GRHLIDTLSEKLSSPAAPRLWPQQRAMLLQIGLMLEQSSSMAVSFGRYLSCGRKQRKLLFTSTTFQWLSGKCPSLVSDEKHRAAYLPVQGDGGEGSTLRAACFAYETKRREHKNRAKPVTDRTQRFDLPMAFSRVLTVFSAFAWR